MTRIARRCEVAEAQSRIIVARADDPVEIDLDQRHQRATINTSSPTLTFSSSAASGSIAIPLRPTFFTDAQQQAKSFMRPLATSIFSPPPSEISTTVSAFDSRTVRIRSVAQVTVGPP